MDEMKVPVNPTPSELNPNIEDIKTKHPFHGFWVQKALPLVYDDSLSYYEVISRIQEYINGLSDDVKTLAANVDNLLDAYNQLVSWVDAEITRYETELNQEFDQHKQAVVQMFNTFKSELETTFEQYKDELKEQSDQHMSELEQQFEAYKNELKTQADQHKSELETQFEGYKSDIDNQISEFKDDVDQTLQEQDRKIQQNSDDISDIQAEQLTQNTNIQKNASDISDIKAEQETQNTNIQNNADAISAIQTEQQAQNTNIQKNTDAISDIQAEQKTQNTNIQNNATAISDIQAEQQTQNTNIQNNANAISEIQTEQLTQNTAIQKNASDISDIKVEQQTQNEKIQQNANNIQTALTEIDGSLAAVESDVLDLQKSQSEQDSTIQSIQTDVSNKANKDGSNATGTWPIDVEGFASLLHPEYLNAATVDCNTLVTDTDVKMWIVPYTSSKTLNNFPNFDDTGNENPTKPNTSCYILSLPKVVTEESAPEYTANINVQFAIFPVKMADSDYSIKGSNRIFERAYLDSFGGWTKWREIYPSNEQIFALQGDIARLQHQSGKLEAIELTNQDLNDYQGENYWGKAYYAGGSHTVVNSPISKQAFSLLILRAGFGVTTQICSPNTAGSSLLYFRTYFEKWSAWSQIIDNLTLANTLSVRLDEKADTDGRNAIGDWAINVTGKAEGLTPVSLSASQNLNDLYGTTWCNKVCYASAENNITNKPSNVNDFTLMILQSGSNKTVQVLLENGNVYVRSNTNTASTWSAWSKIYTDANQPSLENLSGILPITKGGTGTVTAAAARLALKITPENIGALPNMQYRTNADDIDKYNAKTGFYNLEGVDIGTQGNYNRVIVLGDHKQTPSGYSTEIAFPYFNGNVYNPYIRASQSSKWSNWKRLAFVEDTAKIDGSNATGTWPISITGKAEILGTPDATTSQGKWYKIAGGNYALVLWNHPNPSVTDEWQQVESGAYTSVWSWEEAVTIPSSFDVNISRVATDNVSVINSKWKYPINIALATPGNAILIKFYTTINPNEFMDFYIYYSGFSILPLRQVV